MDGGVGREFGGAKDHVICHRALVEYCAKVSADDADVLSGTWVGDAGGQCECSGCWRVDGSSLIAPGHGLTTLSVL